MKRRVMMLIISLIAISLFSVPTFAACDHNWVYDYQDIEETTGDRHVYINHYYCTECSETKDEKEYEKHQWIESSREINPYSKDQHKITTYYECPTCNAQKNEVSYENHSWIKYYDHYVEYSDSQHILSTGYYCYDCDESKTEEKYVNHRWKVSYKNDYHSVSDKLHTYIEHLDCLDCNKSLDKQKRESHHFDQYHDCKECDAVVAGNTILLSPGRWVSANQKTWLRINVAKAGYLTIDTMDKYMGEFSPSWDLYNGGKTLYTDSKERHDHNCVPVKKGTYFVRLRSSGKIKYSFTKDPSKKNYSKKKAIKLKKNKRAVTVIYASGKKKTWKRYYKIKLTKKQFLHLKITENYTPSEQSGAGLHHFSSDLVTTAKNKEVPMETEYDKNGQPCGYISSKKLKKGTYYVCLERNWTSASRPRSTGTFFSLSWK